MPIRREYKNLKTKDVSLSKRYTNPELHVFGKMIFLSP
jgi:hypothetical protein